MNDGQSLQLNDKFLEEVGLAGLPEEQKKPFLQHVYEQLQYRVGVKLSDGMSDDQLQEFESIIDRKQEVVSAWLDKNAPDYKNDAVFGKLKDVSGLPEDDQNLKSEFAATKWLEVNRPDYKSVVAGTLEELKKEITSNKDAILGS